MSRPPILPCLLMASMAASSYGCSFDDKGLTTGGSNNNGGIPRFDGGVADNRGGLTGGSADGSGLSEDANCGLVKSSLMNSPADLLILLDRSGSMQNDSMDNPCQGGCGANSKWTQVTTAINQAVLQTETKVNWGLKFFGSTTNGCAVNPGAEVAPMVMNAATIQASIAGINPGSNTPTRAGVTNAGQYLSGLADGNPKYIVLATDGLPNCPAGGRNAAGADDAPAIQAVTSVAAAGVPVFVVGIATSGGTADMTLNAMAVAGGHPRVGAAQQYYPVSSTADLVAVLDTLQGMVARGCTYRLPRVPPTPSNVKVTVNNVRVGLDTSHTTGWDYSPDMMSIVFYGQRCTDLMAGTAGDVSIILGCGITPIP
jgi:hypothetical protein